MSVILLIKTPTKDESCHVHLATSYFLSTKFQKKSFQISSQSFPDFA